MRVKKQRNVVTSWYAGIRQMPSRRRFKSNERRSLAEHKRVSTGGDVG